MSRRQAWSQLSEMDAQLSALQTMADHMEREFASSRMVPCLSQPPPHPTCPPSPLCNDTPVSRPPLCPECLPCLSFH